MEAVTGKPITEPRELAKIIAEIVREGERWNQAVWWSGWFKTGNEVSVSTARDSLNHRCGTTGCVAGWATILHAPEGSLIDIGDNVILPNGRIFFADTYGRDALALTREQADYLFNAARTQEQVLYALDAIAEGREWDADDEPPETGPCEVCGEVECEFNC